MLGSLTHAVLLELCYTSLHLQAEQVLGYLLRPSKPLKMKRVQEWFEAAEFQGFTSAGRLDLG